MVYVFFLFLIVFGFNLGRRVERSRVKHRIELAGVGVRHDGILWLDVVVDLLEFFLLVGWLYYWQHR